MPKPLVESGHSLMARLEGVIAGVERVREGLCCYAGQTCDCKYGFDGAPQGEKTGCPELRDALRCLRNLKRAADGDGWTERFVGIVSEPRVEPGYVVIDERFESDA